MKTFKAAIIAGSFIAIVAGSSAQARDELDSQFHGNTVVCQTSGKPDRTYAVERTYRVPTQANPAARRLVRPDAHSSYAHVHPVTQPLQVPGNSLLDKIHGQPAQ